MKIYNRKTNNIKSIIITILKRTNYCAKYTHVQID